MIKDQERIDHKVDGLVFNRFRTILEIHWKGARSKFKDTLDERKCSSTYHTQLNHKIYSPKKIKISNNLRSDKTLPTIDSCA